MEVCVSVGLCYRLCELFSMEMTTFFGFDIHKGRLKFPSFIEKGQSSLSPEDSEMVWSEVGDRRLPRPTCAKPS